MPWLLWLTWVCGGFAAAVLAAGRSLSAAEQLQLHSLISMASNASLRERAERVPPPPPPPPRTLPPLSLRPRAATHYKLNANKEDTFHDSIPILHEDHQITSYLHHGESKRYFFLLQRPSTTLTIIITPCNTPIKWALRHRYENETGILTGNNENAPIRESGNLVGQGGLVPQMTSVSPAHNGLYMLQVTAPPHSSAHFTIFATLQQSALLPLNSHKQIKIRLQKRQVDKKLTVRWEQSPYDPYLMNYCVTVSTKRHYNSLCEAISESEQNTYYSREPQYHSHHYTPHVRVACVKRKTSYTVSNMERGKMYYFNVFAINKKTNLTFPFGNASLLYDGRNKALGLRDNRPVTVSLRHLDGKAIFRYKVGKTAKPGSTLEWHVLPCGGSVEAEIRFQKKIIVPRQRIDGYGRLKVDDPEVGQRYSMYVMSRDPEQLRRVSGVEVLATMHATSLPLLPEQSRIMEYVGLRECDSVTVGWLPVPEPSDSAHYCVRATHLPPLTPNHPVRANLHRRANQCGLDLRLRSATDFAVTQCLDNSPNDPLSVITQKIAHLKPGHEYLIQVTVKKAQGKSLSYDLLKVQTKPRCS
ncbi:protein NDNF isoform X2 [Nilaparvata lugens]|uniref:protein NDNF isoform X1 n=1 Tax=Nilaparvata lugens TaxID=108931 RepID=UPI00193D635C|nr:protein NDNF isoform X1 [Nilaparvata lugens]XP_039287882.1 protein NDNF isoform X2 [Nilaparvata lugens]